MHFTPSLLVFPGGNIRFSCFRTRTKLAQRAVRDTGCMCVLSIPKQRNHLILTDTNFLLLPDTRIKGISKQPELGTAFP